jgi:hypothetical protein
MFPFRKGKKSRGRGNLEIGRGFTDRFHTRELCQGPLLISTGRHAGARGVVGGDHRGGMRRILGSPGAVCGNYEPPQCCCSFGGRAQEEAADYFAEDGGGRGARVAHGRGAEGEARAAR